MDKQIVFKSAINGFEKKAVLDYIYKLNQDAEEGQASFEARIRQLSEDNGEIVNSLREAENSGRQFKERCEALTAELEGERTRSDEMGKMIGDLNAELERFKDAVLSRDSEIREHVRINKELKQANAELEQKRLEIENASTKIGKLLIEAHSEADHIIDSAQLSADAITTQARQSSDRLLAEAEDKAATIVREAETAASKLIGEAGVKAEEIMENADMDSARILAEANAASTLKMDNAQKAVDMSLEKLSLFRSQIADIQRVVLDSLESIHQRTAEISAVINQAQNVIAEDSGVVADGFPEEACIPEDYVYDVENDDPEGSFFR